jgi:surface protein
MVGDNANLLPSSIDNLGATEVHELSVADVDGLVEGSTTGHTLVMGNLRSTDTSTLYLDASSGFDATLPITVVAVVATRLGTAVTFKEVNPLPPPPILSLESNGVTIKYNGNATDVPASSARFIQMAVRGATVEWFAVVNDGMKSAITAYANGDSSTPFTPPGQSPVPFNNIVTTLMTNMSYAFIGGYDILRDFNANITSWDTSNVTDMRFMFANVYSNSFNQPIGSWNTSNVIYMQRMFEGSFFNQPLNSWNTSNVRDMGYMFAGAYYSTYFNQPIGSWNTANVTDMGGMFQVASEFNQPLSSWNTANVTSMGNMFYKASAFNQNISSWNVALVTPVPPTNFRTNSALIDDYMPDAFLP